MYLVYMVKIRTSVTIDEEVLKKAREMEINVSAFLEIKLREYIALIEMGKEKRKIGKNNTRNVAEEDENNIYRNDIYRVNKKGSWSSGYDVALTRRRSPVRIRASPFYFLRLCC